VVFVALSNRVAVPLERCVILRSSGVFFDLDTTTVGNKIVSNDREHPKPYEHGTDGATHGYSSTSNRRCSFVKPNDRTSA